VKLIVHASFKTASGSILNVTLTADEQSAAVHAIVDETVVGRLAASATHPTRSALPSGSSTVTLPGELALVGDPPRPLLQVQLPATGT
jgi:hypothetical protein